MSEKIEIAQKEIKQSIFPIFLGAILGFISTLSEIYKLFSQNDFSVSQVVGVSISLLAGVLLLLVPVFLRKENKHALTFALVALGLGLIRWVLIDKAFGINIMTIILMVIFGWFIVRFIRWVKVGALR